jgi:hypothetical protein
MRLSAANGYFSRAYSKAGKGIIILKQEGKGNGHFKVSLNSV